MAPEVHNVSYMWLGGSMVADSSFLFLALFWNPLHEADPGVPLPKRPASMATLQIDALWHLHKCKSAFDSSLKQKKRCSKSMPILLCQWKHQWLGHIWGYIMFRSDRDFSKRILWNWRRCRRKQPKAILCWDTSLIRKG